MAEGFDHSDIPVTRGRRDPELAHRLEAEDMMADPGEPGDAYDIEDLATGDIVAAKVTLEFETTSGSKAWTSYGIQTRVQPGEDEDHAFSRAVTIVNTRVLDQAADIDQRIEAFAHAQAEAAAQARAEQRIRPRNSNY